MAFLACRVINVADHTAGRDKSMYNRSNANKRYDDVFISAMVRLASKVEKAWAAPGDGDAKSESGKLAGGHRARQHCGHHQARLWQGPGTQ